MTRTEELMNLKGAELIKIADKYGLKIGANKERTQLKDSKKSVVEKITKHEAELEKAKQKAKQKKGKKRERKIYEYNGKAQTLSEWAKELDMPLYALWDRIEYYGWSVERAVTTPLRKHKKRANKEGGE